MNLIRDNNPPLNPEQSMILLDLFDMDINTVENQPEKIRELIESKRIRDQQIEDEIRLYDEDLDDERDIKRKKLALYLVFKM